MFNRVYTEQSNDNNQQQKVKNEFVLYSTVSTGGAQYITPTLNDYVFGRNLCNFNWLQKCSLSGDTTEQNNNVYSVQRGSASSVCRRRRRRRRAVMVTTRESRVKNILLLCFRWFAVFRRKAERYNKVKFDGMGARECIS